jgi:hypothetical protein
LFQGTQVGPFRPHPGCSYKVNSSYIITVENIIQITASWSAKTYFFRTCACWKDFQDGFLNAFPGVLEMLTKILLLIL